jgi:hypothetical protein
MMPVALLPQQFLRRYPLWCVLVQQDIHLFCVKTCFDDSHFNAVRFLVALPLRDLGIA